MSKTPDRHPGPLYEDEEIVLQERETDPDIVGAMRRVGGSIRARDASGVFNLRQGAGTADNRYLIFKTDGGIVYNTAGNVVEKDGDT
jgi:hypothetical protein